MAKRTQNLANDTSKTCSAEPEAWTSRPDVTSIKFTWNFGFSTRFSRKNFDNLGLYEQILPYPTPCVRPGRLILCEKSRKIRPKSNKFVRINTNNLLQKSPKC